jgi:hypothetical protein
MSAGWLVVLFYITLDLPVRVTLLDRFPFIVQLLSFAQADLELDQVLVVKEKPSGTIVYPLSLILDSSFFNSLRFNSNFRSRTGSWLLTVPCEYSEI